MDGIKRGHIFYVEKSVVAQAAGSEQMPGRPAVIVSNDDCNRSSNVVEVVYLTTQPKKDLPTHVAIRSSGKPAVALCEQVSSVSVDRLREWAAECTDQEMQMIDIALAISLGIDPEPQVVEKVIEKPVTVETSAPPVSENDITVIRLETERNMYKELYEQTLERLLAKS